MNNSTLKIAICIPVFNDWVPVTELIRQIAQQPDLGQHALTIVLVNDGSVEAPESVTLLGAGEGLVGVELLELHRNIGHQRAIAIGLAGIAEKGSYDAVVVMDGDGEDRVDDIAKLVDEMRQHKPNPIVFARRSRRTEGLVFRTGYAAFKALHWVLTGQGCDVGNFSIIPAQWLKRLVHAPELWNHYSASVMSSRLPVAKVACPRGQRFAGKSHMNMTALVVHGLRAISVFGETVGVRVCLALGFFIGLALVGMAVIVYFKTATVLAIPGWATNAVGLSLILLVNLLVLTAPTLLLILGARSSVGFVPARDWKDLVADWQPIRRN